jgi:hypothetical protein
MTLRFIDFKTSKQQPATSPSVVSTGLKTQGRTTQPNRISKNRFAPGLRSHFGGVGLLSLFFKIDRSTLSLDPEALDGQNTLFDVGRSMFDVRRSSVFFPIRLAASARSGGADN